MTVMVGECVMYWIGKWLVAEKERFVVWRANGWILIASSSL